MIVGNLETIPWDVQPVVPSDSVPSSTPAKAEGATPRPIGIYVGGAGDVVATLESGTSFTFKAVPAGRVILGRFTRIKSTGTTATFMLALYGLA